MEKFQSALYRHYVSGVLSLYRSDDMQALCETHAPHLFYILISTIVSADRHPTSERHSHLQQQRIVVLLHMLPYFRYLLISEHRKACFTPNHFSVVGNLATKDLKVLTLPAFTFYNHVINLNNKHHQ